MHDAPATVVTLVDQLGELLAIELEHELAEVLGGEWGTKDDVALPSRCVVERVDCPTVRPGAKGSLLPKEG